MSSIVIFFQNKLFNVVSIWDHQSIKQRISKKTPFCEPFWKVKNDPYYACLCKLNFYKTQLSLTNQGVQCKQPWFFLTIHNYLGHDWIPTCFKIIILFNKWYFWFGYVHMGSIYLPLHEWWFQKNLETKMKHMFLQNYTTKIPK